jgi:hypothetical protein
MTVRTRVFLVSLALISLVSHLRAEEEKGGAKSVPPEETPAVNLTQLQDTRATAPTDVVHPPSASDSSPARMCAPRNISSLQDSFRFAESAASWDAFGLEVLTPSPSGLLNRAYPFPVSVLGFPIGDATASFGAADAPCCPEGCSLARLLGAHTIVQTWNPLGCPMPCNGCDGRQTITTIKCIETFVCKRSWSVIPTWCRPKTTVEWDCCPCNVQTCKRCSWKTVKSRGKLFFAYRPLLCIPSPVPCP